MGLDQNLFRFTKSQFVNNAPDKITIDQVEELRESSDWIIVPNTEAICVKYLKDCIHPAEVEEEFIDIKKMIVSLYPDCNDDGFKWCSEGYTADGFYTFAYKGITSGRRYEFQLKEDEVKKFVYTAYIPSSLLYGSEVAYWRKNYWLRAWFTNNISFDADKNNTVYIPVDKPMWDKLLDNLFHIATSLKEFDLTSDDLSRIGDNYKYTIEQIIQAVEETDFNKEVLCYYEWF